MLRSAVFVLPTVGGHLVSTKVGGAKLRVEQPSTVIAIVLDEEIS